MHYKITTLVENAVYGRNLQAEHGLSLLIENNGYKIFSGEAKPFSHTDVMVMSLSLRTESIVCLLYTSRCV